MSRATGTVPERVQLRVHTTEPTGPVPEPFHCDHIARWSARSGTTGRSGTGVNTGARLRSGTVPVPKLWCEHDQTDRHRPDDLARVGNEKPNRCKHIGNLLPASRGYTCMRTCMKSRPIAKQQTVFRYEYNQ